MIKQVCAKVRADGGVPLTLSEQPIFDEAQMPMSVKDQTEQARVRWTTISCNFKIAYTFL